MLASVLLLISHRHMPEHKNLPPSNTADKVYTLENRETLFRLCIHHFCFFDALAAIHHHIIALDNAFEKRCNSICSTFLTLQQSSFWRETIVAGTIDSAHKSVQHDMTLLPHPLIVDSTRKL